MEETTIKVFTLLSGIIINCSFIILLLLWKYVAAFKKLSTRIANTLKLRMPTDSEAFGVLFILFGIYFLMAGWGDLQHDITHINTLSNEEILIKSIQYMVVVPFSAFIFGIAYFCLSIDRQNNC